MEYQRITNLLSTTSDNIPRFITKKWVEVHDQSGSAEDRYKPSKQIYVILVRHTYIAVKGDITLIKNAARGFIDIRNRLLAFKNSAPFTNCISKVNNVLIDNAKDLDVLMPMYDLIEYSKNYRRTTGSLLSYYRDEANNPPLNDDDPLLLIIMQTT